MNKKQAYETITYLLIESQDAITIADIPDIKTALNLLATANYMRQAFQLKEDDSIKDHMSDIKEKIYEYLDSYRESLKDIWI